VQQTCEKGPQIGDAVCPHKNQGPINGRVFNAEVEKKSGRECAVSPRRLEYIRRTTRNGRAIHCAPKWGTNKRAVVGNVRRDLN